MKRKTAKEILAESFRELAETKPVDKITVPEIVEICGYHSQTLHKTVEYMGKHKRKHAEDLQTKTTGWASMPTPIILYFFHLPFGQHIHHNLCTDLETVAKSFAIGQNVDLALGGHVIFKELLLFI